MGVFQEGIEPAKDENGVYYLGIYHPCRIRNYAGGKRLLKNPRFDPFSSQVLNLKDGYYEALWGFYKRIQGILNPFEEFAVALVPTHDGRMNTGFRELCECLADYPNRIDATRCLVRHTPVSKQAKNGRRIIDRHLRTVRVEHREILKGQTVLLLDDVSTTGASLQACSELLLNAGAKDVICLVIGKTALDNPAQPK